MTDSIRDLFHDLILSDSGSSLNTPFCGASDDPTKGCFMANTPEAHSPNTDDPKGILTSVTICVAASAPPHFAWVQEELT
jgi:hypothetical protein